MGFRNSGRRIYLLYLKIHIKKYQQDVDNICAYFISQPQIGFAVFFILFTKNLFFKTKKKP